MSTYVIGADGSDYSMAAIDWARASAGADDAIVVVHAWELPMLTGYETAVMLDPEPIEDAAREFLRETLAAIDDPRVSGRAVPGPAARALIEMADQVAAGVDEDAVIVVGHRGSGKVSLLLGSTAAYVIHHTKHPVVVVRGEPRECARHVAVGVDDKGDAEPDGPSMDALRWAFSLPCVEQVDVHHAVFVPGVVAGPLSQAPMEANEIHDATESLLHRTIEAVGGPPAGVRAVPVASNGTASFALIEASREADLVVVGSRGHGGFRELLLGSTTLEVTAYAHCPVAVVR
jgi:nucleotide-binding universal stress UspA family protein